MKNTHLNKGEKKLKPGMLVYDCYDGHAGLDVGFAGVGILIKYEKKTDVWLMFQPGAGGHPQMFDYTESFIVRYMTIIG